MPRDDESDLGIVAVSGEISNRGLRGAKHQARACFVESTNAPECPAETIEVLRTALRFQEEWEAEPYFPGSAYWCIVQLAFG